MIYWPVIAGAFMLSLFILYRRGNRKLKLKQNILDNSARIYHIKIDDMVYVSYHGGYPPIPKPQKLYIGLLDDYLLLLTDEGVTGKVFINKCNKIDKFTTSKGPSMKGRSIVLWGPFVSLFNKIIIRHFILVNYQDIDGQENNILIEHGDIDRMQYLYGKLDELWKKHMVTS